MEKKRRRLLRQKNDVKFIDKLPLVRSFLHPTDLRNRFQFGPDAPRYAETIMVDPHQIEGVLIPRSKDLSGTVVTDFPPTDIHSVIPILEHGKISCCLEKWGRGIQWSETKYLRSQLVKGSFRYGRTPEEQNKHWSKYDRLLESIQREGRLRPRREVDGRNFRESNGILVHIGEDGRLYQGDSGNRRFAAALFAGLKRIPVQVGCVHINALNVFRKLRDEAN